ncbi:hypothetical protein MT1_3153 [Pseudomonas sp. MT-1]|nr:hypothetical protein MT1_3153 [Pseudomonas sp. MT-1]|tara:strand:+ start:1429 stop:1956 length:528 start_codon:yes stop_codon:yes gene_type:complete
MTKPPELDSTRELPESKWADASSDELEEGLLCALDGEYYAERCLIEYFHERMAAGQPYDLSVLDRYLTVVFGQVLRRTAGKEDGNLLLQRSRGRPTDPSVSDRDFYLAAAVLLLKREGLGWEAACNDVADRYGESDRVVPRAFRKYRDDVELFLDSELRAIVDELEGQPPLNTPI